VSRPAQQIDPPVPFEVAVPDADLIDLRRRLARTRFDEDFDNDDWGYGTNGAYLKDLVAYWLDEYDWRAAEAAINELQHYTVLIEDVPVHYVRVPGVGPNPTPLLLSHGWPWTFWDFRKAIDFLTDPGSHGGDPDDSFEVIIPSLPGYVFSTPLRSKVDVQDVARIFDTLMRDVLEFDRYAAAGGDWGSMVTAFLGHGWSQNLLGVHLTLPTMLHVDPDAFTQDKFSAAEAGWYEQNLEKATIQAAHIACHTWDPETVAFGLNDSPVGLASWIITRRFKYADHRGNIENTYTKDDLCTNVALYWFTQSMGSSLRLYADTLRASDPLFRVQLMHDRRPIVQAPTAIAVFPQELFRAPRSAAEKYTNLKRWTVMPRGGHYAPFEEPKLWSDDVRTFFRDLRTV
jgi:pimeloyl-ACP methyl ester carboxylesterase